MQYANYSQVVNPMLPPGKCKRGLGVLFQYIPGDEGWFRQTEIDTD